MKKIVMAAVAAFAVLFAAQAGLAQQAGSLPTLTSKAYASMKKDDVYVVLFSASYCGACRLAKQGLFPELIQKYKTDENVHFYMFDVEQDQPAADGTSLDKRWGVLYLPTFVVVYNDAVMYSRTGYSDGLKPKIKQEIENKIKALK